MPLKAKPKSNNCGACAARRKNSAKRELSDFKCGVYRWPDIIMASIKLLILLKSLWDIISD